MRGSSSYTIARYLRGCSSALCWTAVAAIIAGAAGALFGVAIGAAIAILYGDASMFMSVFVHCLLSSAGAGALVGAFINLSDGCNPLSDRDPDEAAAPKNGRLLDGRGTIRAGFLEPLHNRGRAGAAVVSDDPLLIRTASTAVPVLGPLDPQPDNLIELAAGEVVPADGVVVAGTALVDESEITGQSGRVVREPGDRSRVLRGTQVVCGAIRIRVLARPR
jgi:hypothetical protein